MFKDLLNKIEKGEVLIEVRETHPDGQFDAKVTKVTNHEKDGRLSLMVNLKTDKGVITDWIGLTHAFGKEITEIQYQNMVIRLVKLGLLDKSDIVELDSLVNMGDMTSYILNNVKRMSDFTVEIELKTTKTKAGKEYQNIRYI
jgi:hypothetical protein